MSGLSQVSDRHPTRVELQPDAARCEAVIDIQFLSARQQSALLLKLAYQHSDIVLPLIRETEPADDIDRREMLRGGGEV